MAATLSITSTDALTIDQLHAALAELTEGSVAWRLLADAIAEREGDDFLDDGSDAYVRHLELAGYDDARAQEAFELAHCW